MVQSGKNWRGDDRSAPLDSSLTAHPSPTPSVCATRCNKTNMKPAFAADAARRRSGHDPGTHTNSALEGLTVGTIIVAHQIGRRHVPRECLCHLLSQPLR